MQKTKIPFYLTTTFIVILTMVLFITIIGLVIPILLTKEQKKWWKEEIEKFNELKQQNEIEIQHLKDKTNLEIQQLKEQTDIEMQHLKDKTNLEIQQLKEQTDLEIIDFKTNQLDIIENDLNNFVNFYLEDKYIERRDEILLGQLEYSPIEYRYDISAQYKEEMKLLDEKEKEIIKKNQYVTGSIFEKKSDETKFEKMIVSSFNALTDNVIRKVSIKNHTQQIKKIEQLFEQFNTALELGSKHSFSTMQIGKRVLAIKLKKIDLMLEYNIKVQEEKEILKEERERAKEEKKINDAINKQIEKIEEEKQKLVRQKEIYLQKLETEENSSLKASYLEEINKLDEKENVLSSEEHSLSEKRKMTNAGYVYIISNIGSFGENVYKIGMTRREEPLDRVKELGDASVPFLFDVHALIYSTNAFELENCLHKEFQAKRVNKVNVRKEFFNISLEEIKNVVLKNYNGTVEFIETPEAIEYRETLLIEIQK